MSHNTFATQAKRYFNRPHKLIPESIIDSPAAWRHDTLSSLSEQWTFILSNEQNQEIKNAVDETIGKQLSLTEINAETFALPTLSPLIASWRKEIGQGVGLVLVKGLPVQEWSMDEIERAYWGIGHHLGLPGAQNPQQELLGHVRDYQEEIDESLIRLYRTSSNIRYHCDAADVVGLLCLRTAKTGGQSRVVSTVELFNRLMLQRPELVPRLFEPFRSDRREGNPDDPNKYGLITPCSFDGSNLRTFYHSDYFRSIERHPGVTIQDEEREILDFYDTVGADPEVCFDMWLEPGDMQFISNHTIAHARTAYEDHAEPHLRRHLLRLWLSLESTRTFP